MRVGRLAFAVLGLLLLFAGCVSLVAQNSDQMSYAGLKTSKFGNMPVLPACLTTSVQHGDPYNGPSTIAGKFKSGCTVPWHWHTVAENLVLVSGSGKAEMKGGASHVMSPGDYVYMPGKQTHQFTCTTACVLYLMPDGAFDIHYVDKNGKEIPPEQAFKAPANGGMKKAPATKPGA
jgi:mannose-6-phosphate isomerase-like protein (cupin superfamily)